MEHATKNKIWLTVILLGTLLLSGVAVYWLKNYFEHLPPRHQSGNTDPNSVVNLG